MAGSSVQAPGLLARQTSVSVAPAKVFHRRSFAGDGSPVMALLHSFHRPAADEAGTDSSSGPRRRGRRWGQLAAVVFSAVWIVLGWLLSLDAVGFLVLGIALVVVFQLGCRRPLRQLVARDGAGLARSRTGKVGVAAVLLLIPAYLLVRYATTWVDNSWLLLLAVGVLLLAYVLLRRVVVAVAVTAVLVAGVMWVQTPQLARGRSGDPGLLTQLSDLHRMGSLRGYRDLAVATVDLNAAQPVRLANIGGTASTPMEVGSMTKAMTGLVVADSIRRGELRLDAPVSTYLPQLHGAAAGDVTMGELVTHRAGYAEFGAATLRRAAWSAPVGRNWITTSLDQMMQEVRSGALATRGSYSYSTLGAATAGQAAAAAAGMSYPELMRTRLFEPLGMAATAIQTGRRLVQDGKTASGLAVQPWVFDAYAPGGAAVSTATDLTILATALLSGTAPGLDALTATASTDQSNTGIGNFWRVTHWQTGQTITWHNGQTAGYTSYLGLDREHHTAVIVLSDVAVDPGTTDLGIGLLAQAR